MENELYHHGIKGQKWGIRRFQNPDGSLTKAGKKRYDDGEGGDTKTKRFKRKSDVTSDKELKTMSDDDIRARIDRVKLEKEAQKYPDHIPKKKMRNMSDDEIRNRITRLNLENDLRKLEKSVYPTKGKDFVMKILEKSGENIGTQLVTHAMGAATNKTLQAIFGQYDPKYKDYEFVNPKKGQKDK